jgi:DNA-binding FadR family transcriptional regulator
MRVPKASDVLANDLRERILSGEFPEGTSLPPERNMVAQTQMSRTTGRSGGAFVQRPGGDSVADSVSLLIRGRQVRLAALLEAREGIEPACARLAAKYRTEADLEKLAAANAAISVDGPLENFLQANVDWHLAVAEASHNELLTGFMLALSQAIYTATDNQSFVDAEVRRSTIRAHTRVTEAIQARDDAAALRRMTRHLHMYAEAISEVEDRTAIEVPEEGLP